VDRTRKLWWLLGACVVGAFLLLGFVGKEIWRQAPPIPARVVADDGASLFTRDDIQDGQQVWQSIGGQQVGSIWGHGAYQAPDWSADWLHRECLALQEEWATRDFAKPFAELTVEQQAALTARLPAAMRTNRYDPATGTLTVTVERAAGIAAVARHYDALFGGAPELAELRDHYALSAQPLPDAQRRAKLAAFFFWTSWACATERPGAAVTYTNNWPHEPLIGNRPSGANVAWSIVSVVLLLAVIGAIVWRRAFAPEEDDAARAPGADPLGRVVMTPSMRACAKYLAVVVLLFGIQVTLGAVTAHYTVEGQAFFGIPLAKWLPYAVTRTWHLQTGVFWIATAFLAAGLFLAPLVGGREPRFQRLGVNVLFGALLVVVFGSLAGEWLSIDQRLGLDAGFWIGHQGYEYVELGRAWQIGLFVGLVLWLTLMLRGLWPALRKGGRPRTVVGLFALSSAAIGLMYAAGFLFSARTHLSVMEYWRWWVVHLWVEGFFEVFATAALAFLFTRMGLVKEESAGRAVLASTALYLVAGIPGTFHHLYFSGTPTPVMAVGATFSALEVVPLVLIGLEAFRTWRLQHAAPWMARWRWIVVFFLGVAFWNLVGAGLFGFLINPPIALYYMQGLNTTPVHGHTALFGVYGLLALGLVLVVARVMTGERKWDARSLRLAFWCMNGGLALMVALSLLPIGLAQTVASVDHGLWYARSAEFLQQPWVARLRWLRLAGDVVFLVGVASFAWFVVGLRAGWSYAKERVREPAALPQAA